MVVVDLFGGKVMLESEALKKGYKILYGPATAAACYKWNQSKLKI